MVVVYKGVAIPRMIKRWLVGVECMIRDGVMLPASLDG